MKRLLLFLTLLVFTGTGCSNKEPKAGTEKPGDKPSTGGGLPQPPPPPPPPPPG